MRYKAVLDLGNALVEWSTARSGWCCGGVPNVIRRLGVRPGWNLIAFAILMSFTPRIGTSLYGTSSGPNLHQNTMNGGESEWGKNDYKSVHHI